MNIDKKNYKQLLKQADKVFSDFIRTRDGFICQLCGNDDSSVMQCSHLIKRGKMGTRFEELNCVCHCSSCNFRHNFYPEFYTEWFLMIHGDKVYSDLIKKSQSVKKFSRHDLIDIIQYYQERLKCLND